MISKYENQHDRGVILRKANNEKQFWFEWLIVRDVRKEKTQLRRKGVEEREGRVEDEREERHVLTLLAGEERLEAK